MAEFPTAASWFMAGSDLHVVPKGTSQLRSVAPQTPMKSRQKPKEAF